MTLKGRALLSLLGLAVSAAQLTAEEKQRNGWGRGLTVEVYGGWSRLSRHDLDLLGRAEERWHDINRLQRWDYTRSLDSRFSYSAVGERDLSLAPLGDPVVLGVRLRQDLRTLGLSVGLGYLGRDQRSDIDQSYRISDNRPYRTFYPSQYTLQVRHPDYLVSLHAWAAQLGLQARLPLGRFLSLSFSVAGGPLFVRCRLVDESETRTSYASGYWVESQSLVEMEGKGTGWNLDLGTQLRIGRLGPVALILEASYAVRRSGPIDGSRRWQGRSVDSNAATDLQSSSANGVWQVSQNRYSFAWGQYALQTLGIGSGTSSAGSRNLALDFSGVQLKAGVSVSLARRSKPLGR